MVQLFVQAGRTYCVEVPASASVTEFLDTFEDVSGAPTYSRQNTLGRGGLPHALPAEPSRPHDRTDKPDTSIVSHHT